MYVKTCPEWVSPRGNRPRNPFRSSIDVAFKRCWPVALLVAWVFGMLALAQPVQAEAGANASELQARIADIDLLERQLTERQQEIESLREELTRNRKGLADEIVHLQKSLGVDSYAKAEQHPRICHNLEIMRLISGFNRALESKWAFYQSGCNRLDYLRQSAQDDLRMVTTLNNLKTDALTTQISLVINSYLPEAHTLQIDPKSFELPGTQVVWDELSARKSK
jgi:hypothetical protein